MKIEFRLIVKQRKKLSQTPLSSNGCDIDGESQSLEDWRLQARNRVSRSVSTIVCFDERISVSGACKFCLMMHHSHLTNLDPSAKSAVLKTAVLVY